MPDELLVGIPATWIDHEDDMANGWFTKVYVVQSFARDGTPREVIAVKLRFGDAHTIAKAHAPAKVLVFDADKGPAVNGPGYISDR